MAAAGQKKRADRKRAPRGPGISSDEEGFRASELGGERWERSWERSRAKSRKLMDKLHKDVAESKAKSKKWKAKGAAMLERQKRAGMRPKEFVPTTPQTSFGGRPY